MENFYQITIHDAASGQWLHFENPHKILTTSKLDSVVSTLLEVERLVDENGWVAAGFISYEASPAFDQDLQTRQGDDFPLIWFGLYDLPTRSTTLEPATGTYRVGEWVPTIQRETYNAAIKKIKKYIETGFTYQVNYTFRVTNKFEGSAWSFFVDLVNSQVPGYSAYMDTGTHIICSASPEVFFTLDGNKVTCRPMKGTVKRALTVQDDTSQAEWLRTSPKNRAENIMIVDMIRNDLGKLAKIGSVRVPELFITERYPTLWQMTSSVTAQIDAPIFEIIASLFPCASITGAPKVSTMKIIAELETSPRRIYTGAIGYFEPGRKAQFSVGIRSVLIEKESGQAEYGIGGGIVWDSTFKDEYAEALLKSRVLNSRRVEFSILETMRWTPDDGFFLLNEHLLRMENSAIYFGFPFDRSDINNLLAKKASSMVRTNQRFRLLIDREGKMEVQTAELTQQPARILNLKLAREAIQTDNVFLYHKTTCREVQEHARRQQPDCDDVILYNNQGEITETSIANLVLELKGELVTPPVKSGLLPGTFRAHLLKSGKIQERVITVSDLQHCTQVFVVNSVRGWQKGNVIE